MTSTVISPAPTAPRTPDARTYWLDVLRVGATLAVVCLHVSVGTTDGAPLALGSSAWWAAVTGQQATRWCVAMFVMISGALLLPNPRREGAEDFYRRRLSRLLIPILFWSVFYVGFRIATGERLRPGGIVLQALYGTTYYHLWFLYMILGLYLVAPFLRVFVAGAGGPLLAWSVVVTLTLAGAYHIYCGFASINPWTIFLFSWIPYIGFFLAGYWCSTAELRPAPARLAGPVAIAAVVGSVLITYPLVASGNLGWQIYSHSFIHVFVIVATLAIFTWARGRDREGTSPASWLQRTVIALGPATLGIYLVHPLFILLLNSWGLRADAPAFGTPWLGIPVVTVLAFLLSAIATLTLRRIPIVRAIVA